VLEASFRLRASMREYLALSDTKTLLCGNSAQLILVVLVVQFSHSGQPV
jgi:hypothetical protein